MSLSVERFVNGKWKQNCFLLADRHGDALIIDPGSCADEIEGLIEASGWVPKAILNTHGHYDHIGAIATLVDRYSIPFFIHGADAQLLRQANLYRAIFDSPVVVRVPQISHELQNERAHFNLAGFEVQWFHTPGHTPGGCSFLIQGQLFTGDTLMPNGLGRADLPGGSMSDLFASLEFLARLPHELALHAGHGQSTMLGTALARARSDGRT